ncbi:MAG: PEP-utilizing enzyme [bacterium]|nr:PEP-utilizing enzyme [bacterium]
MAKSVINEHQPSITEWLATIGKKQDSDELRKEDNTKAQRLEQLYQIINLPYERPEKLSATDLTNMTPVFGKILKTRGDELCAIRLVPKKDGLPKLRDRGMTIKECYKGWYLKQKINAEDYWAYICPHTDKLLWSAIFVINKKGIFGEIIKGQHYQLTHGRTYNTSLFFSFDFMDWEWSFDYPEAKDVVNKMINMIQVNNKVAQKQIREQLDGRFVNNYLEGYFETVVWPDDRVYYIDYNRFLPKYLNNNPRISRLPEANDRSIIRGIATTSGTYKGSVVVVKPDDIFNIKFNNGEILVCENTDTRYLPLMKIAGAIITDKGGLLSHAAIIARELKKPCIVGTKNATRILKNGDLVEVNATEGTVKVLL